MSTEVAKIDPFNPEPEIIKKAAEYIRWGKIVAIPTETVYGLAADFNNQKTIKRLYEVKGRPRNKPFAIAVANTESLEQLAANTPPLAYKLVEKFWPGPLTLVLESHGQRMMNMSAAFYGNSEAVQPTIALRMPDNRAALEIIESSRMQVALPSANPSGEAPAQSAQEVVKYFDGKIDLIVDAGQAVFGVESTIVDITQTPFKIIREGAIKKEAIEKITGSKRVLFVCTGNSCRSVMAEGLLTKALRDGRRNDVEVLSAGIAALRGFGPTIETLELLAKEGIDMSGHKSQRVTNIMLKSSDLILVMDSNQEEHILRLVPVVKKRVYLLKEFAKIANRDLNVGDPIGQGADFYEKTFYTIKEAIEKITALI